MVRLAIGLDADDTLWHNEDLFADVEQRFRELMSPWADGASADQALTTRQRERVGSYGFGAKAFALAMIRTACDLSNSEIAASDIATIVGWGDELLVAPTVLIDGVAETIAELHRHHDLYIITKGDLHRQLERIEASGLRHLCVDVEVMATKDAAAYGRVFDRLKIDPERFVMIGNSLVSDVFPVVQAGGHAIHVPYHVTWALEKAETTEPSERWRSATSLAEAAALVAHFPWSAKTNA